MPSPIVIETTPAELSPIEIAERLDRFDSALAKFAAERIQRMRESETELDIIAQPNE